MHKTALLSPGGEIKTPPTVDYSLVSVAYGVLLEGASAVQILSNSGEQFNPRF